MNARKAVLLFFTGAFLEQEEVCCSFQSCCVVVNGCVCLCVRAQIGPQAVLSCSCQQCNEVKVQCVIEFWRGSASNIELLTCHCWSGVFPANEDQRDVFSSNTLLTLLRQMGTHSPTIHSSTARVGNIRVCERVCVCCPTNVCVWSRTIGRTSQSGWV